MKLFASSFGWFLVIGSVGFAVDAGILTLLSGGLGANVYMARAFSFAAATLITWWLNRIFTFRSARVSASSSEYLRYAAVQIVGALTNLLVFAWLLKQHPWMLSAPIVPLSIGAAVALMWNFAGCRYLVFRESRPKSRT